MQYVTKDVKPWERDKKAMLKRENNSKTDKNKSVKSDRDIYGFKKKAHDDESYRDMHGRKRKAVSDERDFYGRQKNNT